ncbi:MAG: hypothetical protein IME96_03995 [Proteobacteria bacterium]|nr:hypothetical protein [Pseudomonadota bacterium]
MKAVSVSLIALSIFLIGYITTFSGFENSRKQIKSQQVKGLTLPPVVLKLMTLEFKTVTADFLFVRASQFYGGKAGQQESLVEEDWQWLNHNFHVITELDPYFQDPYYVANGIFTWDAHMYEEANTLLQKGVDARSWDWWLPFLVGFNKFFFQGKNKEGADYLLEAHKRPGAWGMLPTLAARLYYKEGATETAISFLEALLTNEKNADIRKNYTIRLDALKKILYLERAASLYEDRMAVKPRNLKVLLDFGIIKTIPKDPYGGQFYIDKDGSIKTTSKLAFATLKRKQKK